MFVRLSFYFLRPPRSYSCSGKKCALPPSEPLVDHWPRSEWLEELIWRAGAVTLQWRRDQDERNLMKKKMEMIGRGNRADRRTQKEERNAIRSLRAARKEKKGKENERNKEKKRWKRKKSTKVGIHIPLPHCTRI